MSSATHRSKRVRRRCALPSGATLALARRRCALGVCLVIGCGWLGDAGAQPSPPPLHAAGPRAAGGGIELTLRAALALVSAGVPATRLAEVAVRSAQAREALERTALAPRAELRASGGADAAQIDVLYGRDTLLPGQLVYGFVPTASAELALSVQWPLWDFGRTHLAVAAASAEVAASRAGARATRDEVLAQIASAYLIVLSDAEAVAAAAQLVSQRERELAIARGLVQSGSRAPNEAARAELELESARIALATHEATARQDEMSLAGSLGLNPTERLRLAPPFISGHVPASVSVDPAIAAEHATQGRPELAAARARVERAAQRLAAERAARRPVLSASAVVRERYSNHVRSDSLTEQAAVLAVLAVPLVDAGITARIDAAEVELERAQAELARESFALRTAAAQAVIGRELARTTLERAEAAARSAAILLEQATLRYSNGSASWLELLDAQQTDASARLRVTRSRLGIGLATVQVLAALGQIETLLTEGD